MPKQINRAVAETPREILTTGSDYRELFSHKSLSGIDYTQSYSNFHDTNSEIYANPSSVLILLSRKSRGRAKISHGHVDRRRKERET